MPTQNAAAFGIITGTSQTTQEEARDATSGTANNAPSGNVVAMQYFQSAGRGGGTFRYIRTFIKFDTSSITTATNVVLNVQKAASGDADNVFVVKSNAFTGEDGVLANDDFNNLSFGAANLYSQAATGTEWLYGSGTNDVALNSDAASDINNNSTFSIALIAGLDFNDQGLSEDGDVTNDVNFSGIMRITYDESPAVPPYIKLENGRYRLTAGKLTIKQ